MSFRHTRPIFYLMVIFALLGPSFGFRITKGFNLTFFRLFLVLSIVIIFWNALAKKTNLAHLNAIRWGNFFFVFWFAYALVSLSWTIDTKEGVLYLSKLGSMMLLCLSIPYFIRDEHHLWKLQKVLFYGLNFIVYYAVLESFIPIHLPVSRVAGKVSAAVTSVFHNENDLASCITIIIPFLITALFMLKLKKRYHVWIYVTATMALYTLLATGSRSNTWLALPLIVFTLLLLIPKIVNRQKLTMRNITKGILVTLSSILIVNVMNIAFLSPEAREARKSNIKLWSTFSMFTDMGESGWSLYEGGSDVILGKSGESANVRKFLILNGLHFLDKTHYFGVGSGNVEAWMKKYGVKVNKSNMHNWWAEVLVNFGVIIFLLYMSLYFWTLIRLYKIARKTSHASSLLRWGAAASLTSLIGFFAGGIAPSTAVHFSPFWITFGIALTVIALAKKSIEPNSTSDTLSAP